MSQANRTAQEACDILANRKLVASSGVADPDGWLAVVKRDMRAKHFAAFDAMLAEAPTLSATQLADSVSDTGRAQQTEPEVVNTSSLLSTVSDDGWEPLDDETRQTAHTALSRARQALSNTTKEKP